MNGLKLTDHSLRPASAARGADGKNWSSAEKGSIMFCNTCNNSSIWLIILIIILFGWGGNGIGCGCGCSNGCGCESNNGCGCGCN